MKTASKPRVPCSRGHQLDLSPDAFGMLKSPLSRQASHADLAEQMKQGRISFYSRHVRAQTGHASASGVLPGYETGGLARC